MVKRRNILGKTLLREIRGSLGRYVAILAIIALGAGLFTGLRTCKPSMVETLNIYVSEYKLFDFRLLSTLGFTEEDVAALGALEGVEAANGSHFTDFLCDLDEDTTVVLKAHSITPDVNRVQLISGRMPQAPNECLAESYWLGDSAIGSTIKVSPTNDEDTLDAFAYTEYTVVGTCTNPYYINFERGTTSLGSGQVTAFVYIPEDGFSSEYYGEIFLTMTGDEYVYSDEYEDKITAAEPTVTVLTEERGQLRYEDIMSEAESELADGWAEYNDGLAEYRSERADAEAELADALAELQDGEAELADGEAELADALAELRDGEAELLDGEAELADALAELQDGEAEFTDGETQLADALAELQDAEAELTDGEAELADALAELQDGEAELADGEAQLADAEAELNANLQAIMDGEAELDAAEAELNARLPEVTDGLALLAEQEAQLAAQEEAALAQLDTQQAELEASLAQVEAALAQISGLGLTAQEAALNAQKAQLEAGLAQLAQARGEAEAGFADGWAQLNAARAQLADAQRQIDDGFAQIAETRAHLADARRQIDDGFAQLEESRAELADARASLDEGWAEYNDGLAELTDARTTLDEGWAEYNDSVADLADARAELDQGWADYNDGLADLADARTELADGWAEYEDGLAELADARTELDEGWAEYNDGRAEADAEFADAEAELADALEELKDAEAEIADIEPAEVFVLDRDTNVGYVCFDSDTNIVEGISTVFPIFFFLVAALVCMTTMTRMVDEQRTQIGVLKALGYRRQAIMFKYLFYSGSASLVGSIAGIAIGVFLFPTVIWQAYSIMYGFADVTVVFTPGPAIFSAVAYLIGTLGATWLSCRSELANVPAELIRPKSPMAGKRILLEYITPLWRRLKFLHKVSLRNIFRYKRRMFMMILGIGGCTALLLTGFGISDSIKYLADYQYNEISVYDCAVTFTEDMDETAQTAFLARHGDSVKDAIFVHESSMDASSSTASKSTYLVVCPSEPTGFVDFHRGEEKLPWPGQNEALININLANVLGISVGDSFRLLDDDMNSYDLTVSGIYDNYVYNYVYLSQDTAIAQTGAAPEVKSAYLLLPDGVDIHQAAAALAGDELVSSVILTADTQARIVNMMSSLDYIVLLIIFCAGALAFIVLYNLTNINITERIREIATLKVLGFYPMETASYVFRENLALTALGALLGLPLGIWLHIFVMDKIKVDMMYFEARIDPQSYLYALLLTFLFALVAALFMFFKLRRINMAEALKSIE